MEGNTKQMRAPECIQPTFSEVQTEIERRTHETTYWGILCRTCRELVAFERRGNAVKSPSGQVVARNPKVQRAAAELRR